MEHERPPKLSDPDLLARAQRDEINERPIQPVDRPSAPQSAKDPTPTVAPEAIDQTDRINAARAAILAADPNVAAADIQRAMADGVTPRVLTLGEVMPVSPGSRVDKAAKQAYKNIPVLTAIAERLVYDEPGSAAPVTADAVKASRPGLRLASDLMGKRLGHRFDRTIERRANNVVETATSTIKTTLSYLESIRHPRQQFVNEVDELYRHMSDRRQTPRELVSDLVWGLRQIQTGKVHDPNSAITEDRYPLLAGGARHFRTYNPARIGEGHASNIHLAGPEIANGIYRFLRGHRRDVAQPRVPTPDGFERSLAEGFAASTLESVPNKVASSLDVATRLLPEDGPEAAAKIRKFATDLVILKEHGMTDQDIRDIIFKS